MASLPVWQLLLGTGVLFGLGLPLSQLAAHAGVDVMAFALWPTRAAAIGLAVLGWARHGRLPLSGRLVRFALLAGTFGHAVPASAGYWLAGRTGPGFAALAYTLPPVVTLALSLLLRLEKPAARRLAAVGFGMTGALLLVVGRLPDLGLGLAGFAVLALIPLSIAGTNVYRALHLPKAVPGEWIAALTLLASAGVLATSSLLSDGVAVPLRLDALVWPALQAAAMIAAYLLFFTLQRRAEPVTVSFVGYVSMSTGMAVAAFGFGEALPGAAWPALALIAASMWLIKRSAAPANAPAAAAAFAAPARCTRQGCSTPATGKSDVVLGCLPACA